jgi:hypothetical protein
MNWSKYQRDIYDAFEEVWRRDEGLIDSETEDTSASNIIQKTAN